MAAEIQTTEAIQAQLDRMETRQRDFFSSLERSIPLLKNASDRAVARGEAFALRNSLKKQFGELSHGASAMKAAKAARRKGRP